MLVTGGAGFIGTNLVERLVARGKNVLVLDDLSRPGTERNAEFLRRVGGARVELWRDDCRDPSRVAAAVRGATHVFHFAAQVAVTTSLTDPRRDFEINVLGTLNVLEAIRALPTPPPLVFTSTNKVYGALSDVALERRATRYEPSDPAIAARGIGEERPLDFHSPYGCSKGAADQYVLDYARSFGISAVVFRMSCIYGPHQCGNEDQGWVAHFVKRAAAGEAITVYGDGLQVRDVLYVDDLVEALLLAQSAIERLAGRAFNIGGGPANTTSLVELLGRIEALVGHAPRVKFGAPRVGDQRYYVSDISRFRRETGWSPRYSLDSGLSRLFEWLESEPSIRDRSSDADPTRSGVSGPAAFEVQR
nr:MAG: CDP-paratose 2-epimerase [Pseudomonadota bacterium]